ncbi:MAG: hypothetical protein FD180_1619 [Planctomycetota bacterium]|nr:MAG: hypothetical protein FD180_1619 [Planctomycetota bacterium]
MKRSCPAILCAAFLAGAASADDAEERLRAAIARLADEDPEIRATGRARLSALATERPELVRRVTDHADPEVGATARRILFDKCILKDLVAQKRFDEILSSIADPARDPDARRELFREFLDLGPEAAAQMSSELGESQAKTTTLSVTFEPGECREIELRMRNVGLRALWYDPLSYAAQTAKIEKFGAHLGCGGRLGGRRFVSSLTPTERVLSALSKLRRVSPGSEFVLATFGVESNCCGLFRLRVLGGGSGELKANFHGAAIPASPASLGELPDVVIPFLAPRESSLFEATLVRKGPEGRPAIHLKALLDVETGSPCVADSFWWASTDAAGRYLGSGPMRDIAIVGEEWKESEERTVEMPCDPPAGTRKLWLGFDIDGGAEQAVPPPLEIPESGADY